jgi:hypothetical protein
MKRHLTNDELLDRLYGLGKAETEVNRHLGECVACAARWCEFERRRDETAVTPVVSSEFLAAQRRRIYGRLEQRQGMHVRWAPALVAMSLLAVGLLLYSPASRFSQPESHSDGKRPVPSPVVEISDEQLFSDLYSMEQSAEPRAAAPIHSLFEAPVGEGEQ